MIKLTITFLLLFFYSISLTAQPLRLAVAANFKPTLLKLVDLFQSNVANARQHKINVTSASTGVLYAQIVQGAPFDLFFSADTKTIDELAKSQLVLDQHMNLYANGRLSLWAKNQSDFMEAQQRICGSKLVMANPKVAPYGIAAERFLSGVKSRDSDHCQPRIVFANNVVHGLQIAQLGYVDYALLPLSLLKNRTLKGHYWPIMVDEGSLLQSMAVLKSSQNSDAAIQFFQFMQSDQAQSLIEKEGYYRVDNE